MDSSDPRSHQPQARYRSNDSVSREALQAVLRQTDAIFAQQLQDSQAIQKLKEVAQRHASEPFDSENVVKDLVRTVLADQLAGMVSSPEQMQAVVDRVAGTLISNPEASHRLESLWLKLSAGKAP